jgi:outer membrane lipoprotein-sorting protein
MCLDRTPRATLAAARHLGCRLVLSLGWALLITLSGAAPAWALDLSTVTQLLAQRKSGEARFTEERFVSGFDGPLRSSGTLSFVAPDRFVRTTLEPRPESMAVDGNNLILKRGGRTRQMTLDAIPEITALIEAVRGTLTGNATTLEKHFRIQVDGSAGQWTLTLVPRDQRLATQVRELKITGARSDMRVVELWLAGGDRSVMSIDAPQAPK